MPQRNNFTKIPTGRSMNRTSSKGVGQNNCTLVSHRVSSIGSTDSAGISTTFFYIDPFAAGNSTPTVASIAGNYEFYRIRSMSVEVLPAAGSQATGTITMAFINGSELMKAFTAMSDSTRINFLSGEQGATIFSWADGGTLRYNSSRVTARKWFQTNVALASTPDDIDRTEQTMLGVTVSGPGTVAIGIRLVFHVTWEFSGLSSTAAYTLGATLASPYPVLPYYGDELPPGITIHGRAGDASYIRETTKPVPPASCTC